MSKITMAENQPEKKIDARHLWEQSLGPQTRPQPDIDKNDNGANGSVVENFDLKPHELVAYLDQYIVRQDKAKAILATKICTHFNRARYLAQQQDNDLADEVGLIKNNILLIGPTGVGKTYLIKLIAARLGVPFVKADATKFSETGYVGGDVEDLVRDLVREANGDLEKAQYGIIYLDEIDKIASSQGIMGPDVSRTGVQRALLKPMEDTMVSLKAAHDPLSQIQAIEQYRRTGKVDTATISTRHMLFIMSGAFGGLADIIKDRLNKKSVGFAGKRETSATDEDYLRQATSQDLVNFGFENEFIGRLPILAMLESLNKADLLEIMSNPNNPVMTSKRRDFAAYGIDLQFTDEALQLLAEQAAGLGTGARAIVSVLENALTPFEQALPAHGHIKSLLVNRQVVQDPEAALQALLANPDCQTMEFAAALKENRDQLLAHLAGLKTKAAGQLPPLYHNAVVDEYQKQVLPINRAVEKVLQKLAVIGDFEKHFAQTQAMAITLDNGARLAILAKGSRAFLQDWGKVLAPGLALVRDRLGQREFVLPALAVEDMDAYLRQIFEQHYHNTH